MNRPLPWLALAAAAFLSLPRTAAALGEASAVSEAAVAGGFDLVGETGAAPVVVAAEDFPGVARAAGDLCSDIEKVSGRRPELLSGNRSPAGSAVIVGTLGHSAVIDRLVRSGKIDSSPVAGKWEAFLSQVVDNPLPGVTRALVIAGSDKRGTIFGIYTLSGQIGVSPWYWWADVPVPHRSRLIVSPGARVDTGPAVKYRGIFLNDEAPALTGWVKKAYGGYNHPFYTRVFELLLRLKANTLWPAMWNSAFNDDDPLNPKLADEYGIVMGTSHHEPMMRAQKEWGRHGTGPWDYTTNAAVLRDYWTASARRNRPYESLYTVGMRGDGDMPMSAQTNVALLEGIVADQRRILAAEVNPDLTKVPQVWSLYKEVQDYYEKGMSVPDDITMLWSDDNFGNLRRVPLPTDKARSGGSGIYYHVDYVGGPRSYKWICTVPVEKIGEQMNLAYRYGADRLWILNVGDLKPMELDTEFFLSFAWNPDAWPKERIGQFATLWAAREFGPEHATEIAAIVTDYLRISGRRKPELLEPGTYSLAAYDEAEHADNEARDLIARSEAIGRALPAAVQDAYFQLVLYPAKATAQVAALYIAAGRSQMYAAQGRPQANAEAAKARALFKADSDLSFAYNHTLAGGKWEHMMDQTHIGYTSWNEPPRNALPLVKEIAVPDAPAMGLAVEGSAGAWPGSAAPCELPAFDAFNRQRFYVDVFNRGHGGFDFTARADSAWIRLAPVTLGTATVSAHVGDEARVWVDIDWALAPAGTSHGSVRFTDAAGQASVVGVTATKAASPAGADEPGFVETGGLVSIEAEHTTARVGTAAAAWEPIPKYGRTLSSMGIYPVTAASALPPLGPRLEYRIYVGAGDATMEAYLAPTLPFVAGRGLRFAVSLDDGAPSVVTVNGGAGDPAWTKSVEDNVRVLKVPLSVPTPGAHRLSVWGIDPGVVLQKIVIDFGGEKPSYLGPPESFFWQPVSG